MQKNKNLVFSLIILILVAFFGVGLFSGNIIVYANDQNIEEITFDKWDGTSEEFSLLNSSMENTEENPYIINTAKKLAYLTEMVNSGESYEGKYFKLTTHIDLNGVVNEEYEIYGGQFWNSIGYKNSTESYAFSGYFDGGNKRIINLVFESHTNYNSSYGLFGYTDGATIKNINIEAKLKLIGQNVGGLIGYSKDTKVSNCYVSAEIKGSINNVGGVAGFLENTKNSTIEDITGSISIRNTAQNNTSGIIGVISNSENKLQLLNSTVYVDIDSTSNTGGVSNVELSNGETIIDGCNPYGQIDANSANNIAGVLGVNNGANVMNCKNGVEIVSTGDYVAGIVAINSGVIYNCVNNVKISGKNYTAGIVSTTTNEINNCVNKGEINGENYTAGICASATKNVQNYVIKCNYNTNIVIGEEYVSGVIANVHSVDVKYCFNTVDQTNEDGFSIIGTNCVAGVVAKATYSNIYTIYNLSNVYSLGSSAGLIAEHSGGSDKCVLQEFIFIGTVKGETAVGVTSNASSIKFMYGYTLPTLEFVSTENYNTSGAISGNFALCSFENVYVAEDFCEVLHGVTSNDNNEIIATTSSDIAEGQLKDLILPDQQTMAFYYLEQSGIDKTTETYCDYYPVLRNLFLDVYMPEFDNYFTDSSAVQNFYDNTMIFKTYDAVTIKFKTNCDVEIEDLVVKQNQDLTELFSILPEVSKSGYDFVGWFTDAKCKKIFNLENGATHNLTLYAKFDVPFMEFPWWIFAIIGALIIIVLGVTFFVTNRKKTITFKVEGVNIQPVELKIGQPLILPEPLENDKKFDGWYYTEDCSKKFELKTMPNVDLVLFGKFVSKEEAGKNEKTKNKKVETKSKTTKYNKNKK